MNRASDWNGPSLWEAIAPIAPQRPTLRSRETAPVAIVGAGIAGLSLALHLAREGLAPIVLEGARPGAGALGASAGIIAPQLVRETPDGVLAKLGQDLGSAWLALVAESGGYLFDLIADEAIDCSAVNRGFIAPTASSEGTARLRAVREQWLPWRRDIRVLDDADVRRLTGCKGYVAGILDESGGALDPVRLAHGLAARAEAHGARIFQDSRALSLSRTGSGWRIETGQGAVEAPQVALCANGGNGALHPALRQTVLPLQIYEMATDPVPEAMLGQVLPEGHCMTDLELDIFSIRYADRNRLVTAYPVGRRQSMTDVERQVNERLGRTLIDPHPVTIANLWHGTAWINSSLLPRIVRVEDGLLAIQACNGRGLATNAIVGREVARTILGAGRYDTRLACAAPQKISRFWLAKRLPTMLISAALPIRHLRDRLRRRE